MSLDTFRNKILSNSGEGRVQVNQRDLIDKILARYSCKFVIYRELMQNSDDAESSSGKIIFETNGNKITRILCKNNGFAFRPEDWDRLVKIAEGNPDEQKIGAFGVGFYSLFSVTENPFVFSGGQGMAFFWRGNQIFTKQGPIDDDDDKGWTTFLMDTREPLEIPNIEKLSKFLVNSLNDSVICSTICLLRSVRHFFSRRIKNSWADHQESNQEAIKIMPDRNSRKK